MKHCHYQPVQNKSNIIIIGLLGGIGSGKSTIARLFKELGKGLIIDADKIGHQVLNHPAVIKKLVGCYGRGVLNKRGEINRDYLGAACFSNKKKIYTLNQLVHPKIRQEINKRIKSSYRRLIILDAALLLETGLGRICRYLVFVNTPYQKRQLRVMRERKWGRRELRQRERFQLPLQLKRQKADFVVQNTGNLPYARQQVLSVIKEI